MNYSVDDLSAAKAFFLDIGLEVHGEWEMEGDWLGQIIRLTDVKTACVGLRTSDGQAWIELVKFYSPLNEHDIQKP